MFYHPILDYPMASGNLTDENIKSLCCLLRIFETRIANTIMTNQHQHHDCEEGITMFDIIEIIAQLYAVSYIVAFFNHNKAFSFLWPTKLTLTEFQESCWVCHLLECPFNSLRAFYGKRWKYSLQIVHSSVSQCLFTVIVSTRMKGKFIIIH